MNSHQKQVRERVQQYLYGAQSNPSWFLMDVLSRFQYLRRFLRWIRVLPNPRYPVQYSLISHSKTETAHLELKQDGYLAGFQLSQQMLGELQHWAQNNRCYGNKELDQGFLIKDLKQAEEKTESIFSIAVYHKVEEQLPAIIQLAHDPLIMQIAANYFCTTPIYTDCRLWWTFPAGEKFDRTNTSAFFHSDRDDYSALRLFFYLSDVDEKSGAHELIRGSHKNKRIRDLFSLDERNCDQIVETYGQSNVRRITGAAGSGFLEDPFIFHRSTPPEVKPRLVLQLRYATRDHQQFASPDNDQLQQLELP